MDYLGMEEDKRLVQAVPSRRQLDYQSMEFLCFIHFGMNTFTGKEWGAGNESEEVFCPGQLDAEQWVRVARDGGMRGVILTCKHHDGYCLWPSRYTQYSVKNSPYREGKGDVVREVAEACRKYGLKFGVYLSPWDRHSHYYGTGTAYDEYYVNQLTELLTGYGDIFAVWLDGACGEGANGKRQIYHWSLYFETVRRLQPDAVISVCGPDVRWCGNEAGKVRSSEWSVVSADMANIQLITELSQQEDNTAFKDRPIDCRIADIGSREKLKDESRLIYYPAETDVSIRPGWFYHQEEDERVRSFENLKDLYLKSVGGNTTLLLNIPPDRRGMIHDNDVKVLKELGTFIKDTFSDNLAEQASVSGVPEADKESNRFEALMQDNYDACFSNRDGEREMILRFTWQEARELAYLTIKEDIRFSQRVERFMVNYISESGAEELCYDGTVIGYKKIIPLNGIKTRTLSIHILDSRVSPALSFVGIYE